MMPAVVHSLYMIQFQEVLPNEGVKGNYRPVASINQTVTAIAQQHHLAIDEFDEDGFGWSHMVVLRASDGKQIMVIQHLQSHWSETSTMIEMIPDDPTTPAVLDEFLAWLGIGAADLTWLAPVITLPTYRLWRQDDNGQTFHIETVSGLGEAIRRVKAFEALGHKQCYWYEQA